MIRKDSCNDCPQLREEWCEGVSDRDPVVSGGHFDNMEQFEVVELVNGGRGVLQSDQTDIQCSSSVASQTMLFPIYGLVVNYLWHEDKRVYIYDSSTQIPGKYVALSQPELGLHAENDARVYRKVQGLLKDATYMSLSSLQISFWGGEDVGIYRFEANK